MPKTLKAMVAVVENSKMRSQRGQSIVEIALITPLLLVVLYIPFDFGVAFFTGNLSAITAREGARIGSGLSKTGGSEPNLRFTVEDADKIRDAIASQIPKFLKSRKIVVSFYEAPTAPSTCMEFVEVRVEGTYNFFLYQLLNFFGADIDDSIIISRTTRMRYNQQVSDPSTPCATMSVDHQEYSIADA
jgi:hypothetical protein